MSEYKGMQWFKCDFQMQTPGDRLHWDKDDPAYLRSKEDLGASVEAYLKRCHDVGLQMICVTDHNLAGLDYLVALREHNAKVAYNENKQPLTILPGIEVEIQQGLGIHMLCIFDERMDPVQLNDVLTELGLPTDKRFNDSNQPNPAPVNYSELLDIVQGEYGGVVIAAHPSAAKGFLNESFTTENFQQELFTDSRLLAIEVPKPLNQLSEGWQKLLSNGKDCNPEWKRERPLALVMSSDCYRLKESEQEGAKAHIGKRFTWVKMSKPSVESIRQAFCDPGSRIRLTSTSPKDQRTHSSIRKLKIKAVGFLDDQTVNFSPHLNCIIGGRGSGKSTVLEYLRLALSRKYPKSVHNSVERIKRTVHEGSSIRVEWSGYGKENDVFEYKNKVNTRGEPEGIVELVNREVDDLDTVLRTLDIRFISQSELSALSKVNVEKSELGGAGAPTYLLELIDEICSDELEQAKRNSSQVKEQVQGLLKSRSYLEDRQEETRKLQQEIYERKRALESIEEVKAEYADYQKAQTAETFIARMEKGVKDWSEHLTLFASKKPRVFEGEATSFDEWPAGEHIRDAYLELRADMETLSEYVSSKAEELLGLVDREVEHGGRLEKAKAILAQTKGRFVEKCKEHDLDENQIAMFEQISEELTRKESDLAQNEDSIVSLKSDVDQLAQKFDELHAAWKVETDTRERIIKNNLEQAGIPMVMLDDGRESPFVDFSVEYLGNESAFLKAWEELTPKKTTVLGREWIDVGKEFYRAFLASEENTTPWKIADDYIRGELCIELDVDERSKERIAPHLLESERTLWEDKLTSRIPDKVDIRLYREDGTCAGTLTGSGLSDGQKNTAVLALLLANGTGPIIIDQPEDELDSAFVYQQLVPLVREVRNRRQVIFATHNANLPVSGDAELVYALKTENGKGVMRTEGGLDRNDVKQAILDIMEGSKAAFERRQEIYKLESGD